MSVPAESVPAVAERVHAAYDAIAAADRPEVWIALRARQAVLAEAAAVDPALPLAGRLLAVKDNIDVAGLETTAGCPAYAYRPAEDAPSVGRLRAAGAVVLGKTNLDQFATGLVGTRSPFGAVRDARRPAYVSGGSSSGSAVAVALGIADLALGTDTAGSGRIPAAFQGVVGLKPSYGLVPARGIVPACRSLDCVSVFARAVALAEQALWAMAGPDPSPDPSAARVRGWPATAPLAAPPAPRLAVPAPGQLSAMLSAEALNAFAAAAQAIAERAGATLVPVDSEPLLAAGRLLYEGAFVAERHAAFGAFAAAHPEAIDPSVREIVTAAAAPSASALTRDGERIDGARGAVRELFAGADALLLPTAPGQPTLAAVAADPLAVNARLGLFTTFVNLLDLCAVAVPAGRADGGEFGVSVIAPAFADRVVADLARALTGEPEPPADASGTAGPPGVALLAVGAHRSGQPLNHELTGRGARRLGVAQTASTYRLYALATAPPKPGLVRVTRGGHAIEGELWELSTAALGSFLAALAPPMALGSVELDDGRRVVGFTCEAAVLDGAPDISHHGSWPAYLAAKDG
jgi:allophanate hydrolase